MATLISAQCCDLGLGDFDPDASPASIPNGEPSIGYVAMKSANDAQQDLILADGELRNHDSSFILRKYVNCPACTVLELQQGTHLGQNKPEALETRSLSSMERATAKHWPISWSSTVCRPSTVRQRVGVRSQGARKSVSL